MVYVTVKRCDIMGYCFTLAVWLTASTVLGITVESKVYKTASRCLEAAQTIVDLYVIIGVWDIQGGDICRLKKLNEPGGLGK